MRRQSETNARRLEPARGGFTLIEVLAAVALLGILYAVLARVAIEGLRAEGDSERRLEASLLADERVNDLVGAPVPPFGHTDTAEGDFALGMDVTPFAVPAQWRVGGADGTAPLLLAEGPNGGAQALRTVQIKVAWLEGGNERHVSRTLFLLDFQSVAALASATGTGSTPPPTGGTPQPPAQDDSAQSPPEEP